MWPAHYVLLLAACALSAAAERGSRFTFPSSANPPDRYHLSQAHIDSNGGLRRSSADPTFKPQADGIPPSPLARRAIIMGSAGHEPHPHHQVNKEGGCLVNELN